MSRSLWWLLVVAVAAVLIPICTGCAASSPAAGPEPVCVGPGCPIPGPDGKIVARPEAGFTWMGGEAPTTQPEAVSDAD